MRAVTKAVYTPLLRMKRVSPEDAAEIIQNSVRPTWLNIKLMKTGGILAKVC